MNEESIADQLDWRFSSTRRAWLDKAGMAAELATIAETQGEELVAEWLRQASNVYAFQAQVHPAAAVIEPQPQESPPAEPL
jgi:hypothetical protein